MARVRLVTFVLAGLTAGLAAVLVTSSAGSYYPNLGTGYLLPAYAAAFLGLSLGGGLQFNVLGSYLGVLLLGMVSTGLTMMNQPSWVAALVQGIVLIAAVAGIADQEARCLRPLEAPSGSESEGPDEGLRGRRRAPRCVARDCAQARSAVSSARTGRASRRS